jgi:hypothetical protein
MAKPRSSLAELERLLRLAEPGSNNLGQYLAEAGEELAVRLGIDAEKLAGLVRLPDEEIAPVLDRLFEHRATERGAARQVELQEVALAAAQRLGSAAIWTNDIAAIDVRLLLGELLLDASKSHLLFDAHGLCVEFQVSLPRSLLINVARELGRRPDLVAAVDEQGLHLRWNGGRGGLNFFSRNIPASERANVLLVHIAPPFVAPRRVPPPRSHWFSDLLSEVALA